MVEQDDADDVLCEPFATVLLDEKRADRTLATASNRVPVIVIEFFMDDDMRCCLHKAEVMHAENGAPTSEVYNRVLRQLNATGDFEVRTPICRRAPKVESADSCHSLSAPTLCMRREGQWPAENVLRTLEDIAVSCDEERHMKCVTITTTCSSNTCNRRLALPGAKLRICL